MTNQNLIQRGTKTTGLAVMIGKCPFDDQHGDPSRILRMLDVLISSIQTTTKATTQLRDTKRKMNKRRQQKWSSLIFLEKSYTKWV